MSDKLFNEQLIEIVAMDELLPNPDNPRTITDKSLDGLTESMHKFGVVEPIVWNKRTKQIVGGHQRAKVLKAAGVKQTKVIVVDLSQEDENVLNLTLNNKYIQGDWNLDSALGMLQDIDIDMSDSLRLTDLMLDLKASQNIDVDLSEDNVEMGCRQDKEKKHYLYIEFPDEETLQTFAEKYKNFIKGRILPYDAL